MQDRTIDGIYRPSNNRSDFQAVCSIGHCEKPIPDEIGIQLCVRHLQKAWAAYQVVKGATLPDEKPDRERDRTSLDARGIVYIARVGDLIKIGWTSRAADRMRALKVDAILHYMPGTRRDEYKLQSQFIDCLAKGREWFHSNEKITTFIRDLQSGKAAA